MSVPENGAAPTRRTVRRRSRPSWVGQSIDWELPGGIVEPSETPRDAAIREVREELGIDLAVGRLLVVDWLPPYLGWDDAVELIFDGGLVEEATLTSFVLQDNEIQRVGLVSLEAAVDLVTPLCHRRLCAAVDQLGTGAVYLEDGRRIRSAPEST